MCLVGYGMNQGQGQLSVLLTVMKDLGPLADKKKDVSFKD